MTTIAPTVFEQRLARGCVLSGRSHPATGLWSGRISRGEASRSFTAGSHADLILEARAFIAEVCAEDAAQQAERRAQGAQDRNRTASLKKYPEIIRTLPNLGPGLSGTVFRKPGGQNLWRVSLRGPAGYGWEPKQTWTDERSATRALRMHARAAAKVMKADLRRTAAHDKAVTKALALATQHSDLTLAKDLAWDIVTRKAPELGVRIDTRNGNSTGCCDQAPKGARDSSRIIDTGKGMVLVKSVWWTHHSRQAHTKRTRAALAWIGTSGELVIVQAPEFSRTVTGALAAAAPKLGHSQKKAS